MQIFQFTEQEYQAIIKKLDDLNEKLSGNSKEPRKIIYDNADALRILKVSRRTLQSWRTEGLISFSQVGSKIFYSQQDLDEFMQRNYKKRFA